MYVYWLEGTSQLWQYSLWCWSENRPCVCVINLSITHLSVLLSPLTLTVICCCVITCKIAVVHMSCANAYYMLLIEWTWTFSYDSLQWLWWYSWTNGCAPWILGVPLHKLWAQPWCLRVTMARLGEVAHRRHQRNLPRQRSLLGLGIKGGRKRTLKSRGWNWWNPQNNKEFQSCTCASLRIS